MEWHLGVDIEGNEGERKRVYIILVRVGCTLGGGVRKRKEKKKERGEKKRRRRG